MHRRIETLLGNLDDFPVGARAVERLRVSSSAMTHRVLRLPSSIGDLGLMIAYPDSIAQAVEIAHAFGNRHIPVIRDGDAIVVGYAGPLEELLERSGVRYERTARVMERPFVYAHAPHTHD